MADPNSVTTRLRRWLAERLNVQPDIGEGWCLNCSLNGGRTRVISATAIEAHAREHTASEQRGVIDIETRRQR
jgi:hypothetical protein